MSHEEKGVYIDLLCHQHQDGWLPADTGRLARIANLPHNDFLRIWSFLSAKFEQKDSKLYNKKLERVVNGRSEHGEMRRIIGTFGRILKDYPASDDEKKLIRKSFNYKDFLNDGQQNLSKTISKWITSNTANTPPVCSPNGPANIGNGTEDGNGNVFCIKDFGKNENLLYADSLIGAMVGRFMDQNAGYFLDKGKDFTALREVAEKIHEWLKVPGSYDNPENRENIGQKWSEIITHIRADPHFSKYSLSQINKYFSSITQSLSNGRNGAHQQALAQKNGTSQSRTDALKGWGLSGGEQVP